MSFSSINAVRASGGLGGTTRSGPATFAPPMPQRQERHPQAPPPGSSYTLGAGMQSTGRMPQTSGPFGGSNMMQLNGPPQTTNMANSSGVVAGSTQPSAVGPQQQMQFDPRDPNNAALAGYMAAR